MGISLLDLSQKKMFQSGHNRNLADWNRLFVRVKLIDPAPIAWQFPISNYNIRFEPQPWYPGGIYCWDNHQPIFCCQWPTNPYDWIIGTTLPPVPPTSLTPKDSAQERAWQIHLFSARPWPLRTLAPRTSTFAHGSGPRTLAGWRSGLSTALRGTGALCGTEKGRAKGSRCEEWWDMVID